MMEFRLPELGEGIDSATVVGVLVQPGDRVQPGQNVLAVETDKAAVEVPIDTAGIIGEIRVKPGDKISVGSIILTVNGKAGQPREQETSAKQGHSQAATADPRSVHASRSVAAPEAATTPTTTTARETTAAPATAAARASSAGPAASGASMATAARQTSAGPAAIGASKTAAATKTMAGPEATGTATTPAAREITAATKTTAASETNLAPENGKPAGEAAAASAASQPVSFKLPELGEGIETAVVVGVLVKPGDEVAANQNVLAMETDKAAFEVPIDRAGQVLEIKVKPGDKLRVGADVLTLAPAAGVKSGPLSTSPASRQESAGASPRPDVQHLDGHGGQNSSPVRQEPAGTRPSPDLPSRTAPPKTVAPTSQEYIPAGPATRRLARELGVSLSEVRGTGRGGRVTLDDIKLFIRTSRQSGPASTAAFSHPPLPDFSKYGEIEVKPVSTIRRKIAENLSLAWRTIPAVTQHDVADITELEAGRKRVVEHLPKNEAKITWTVLAVKACVAALKDFPHFNASFDLNAGTLILKKYFHIGIAVDTERGLVVPVIRHADTKSIRDIAAEVASLAEKARAGKLTLEEMRGGSFTITNLGGIGGTSFTPIINYPEVAILGMSRSSWQPVVRDGQIVPRLLLPLSLTYDHRVIDGADGARFITRISQLFSDPMRLLMES